MQIALISAAYGLFFFVVLYLGFRTGLRLGMQTAKGIVPPKIRNPVEIVKRITEEEKPDPQGEMLRGFANMMAFTGEAPEKQD